MARLKAAREAAAAKMIRKSPLKESSPWKVSTISQVVSDQSYSPPPRASNFQVVSDSSRSPRSKVTSSQVVSKQSKSPRHKAIATSSQVVSDNSRSPQHGSGNSTSFNINPFDCLEVQINDDGSDNNVTPLVSPACTPVKKNTPSYAEYDDLLRQDAFCFSPASAATFSKNLKAQTEKRSAARGKETETKSASRRLFISKISPGSSQDGIEERLHRLEVLTREVSSKTDLLLMNLGRLQRSLLPSEKRIVAPPNMPKLPLESKEQLNKFEHFLASSDSNLSGVCDYLSCYIRTSVPDPERKSAQAILTHLLYNSLAKDMNLEGGNGKIGFRSLNLHNVFLGTLQTAFPKSDLKIGEDALQKWLKDAKWRKQKRPSGSSVSDACNKKSKKSEAYAA